MPARPADGPARDADVVTRHPDLFAWAGSFSGAVDIVHNGPVAAVIGAEAIADGGGRQDVFGSRRANLITWRAANPYDLAGNLRGLALYLATRSGQPERGRRVDFVRGADLRDEPRVPPAAARA